MFFEWMSDPAAWAGLATLIVLEIVLGVDNLVFIAVLAEKLPPHQRDKARIIGLSLALIMRFILLASIAWIVTLQAQLFSIFGHGFSGRDLILIFGGLFLLFKGTTELHERLEGHHAPKAQNPVHAAFWQVLLQIVVLDAVFSLDSVITAVGMVQHLSIMYIAVVVAMGVMLIMSKPLMAFVNKHPTVVILCLGFLMMIGFSLITEGFGFHVPKGYLYAAIGFSVGIEALNQIARRNRERFITSGDLRDKTAAAVLRLLGGGKGDALGGTADVIADQAAAQSLFAREEKEMIQGVLSLSYRPATSVMTPRSEVDWIDLNASEAEIRAQILQQGHSRFLVARGALDDFIGIALTRDLMRDLLTDGVINMDRSVREVLVVHESVSVLRLMEQLRQAPVQLAVIVDEFGSLEGIATPTDVLEAIAGDFPSENEAPATEVQGEDGSWLLDGWVDIRRASQLLEVDLEDDAERYSTLAGYLLRHLRRMPVEGEEVVVDGLVFDVVAMQGHAIDKLRIRKQVA
ncbi:integral membrane protein TerC [Ketogulonicigenium robustum]|uniref:Integral membrane protein TerC n=1 Tax=Ketogulonicigenium robustum TaxID=92947 RepID=A0A1W6P2U9_9RHOB|nr:TerC family protein [Ketogulonicigenium robustum]ARO15617.1 integral membrane protein TerC [Ketogulonicigenium robustum]